MKKFVCFVVCILMFYGARADYWEICTSQPGELCWGMIAGADDNTGHDGINYDEYADDYYSVLCDMDSQYIDGPAKSFLSASCSSYDEPGGTCLIGNLNNLFCVEEADANMYIYDFPCDFCRNGGDDEVYEDWSSGNSNNAIVRRGIDFINDFEDDKVATCTAVVDEDWGCPTGYYYVSGSGSSTVCAVCPSSATCIDGNGHNNTLQWKCNDGYFYNGTTCERCPSSGGVYGITGKIGAQSRTECYIPSGGSFSDATGSGVFVGDCYYSE